MGEILQNEIPAEMHADVRLPGMSPCGADDWLRVDEAYAAQMAYRLQLMSDRAPSVLWLDPTALEAAQEVLAEALNVLPGVGFEVRGDEVLCPDGRVVAVDRHRPLQTLGALVQEDVCILQKRGDQHVLTGAVLCFPASWTLADKVGRPLTEIHSPVPEYHGDLARRVQRLFDGVQAGKPLWRFNRLGYRDADLHQPRRYNADETQRFVRSERQCVVRMPRSQAVVFSIHTYVIKAQAW